MCGRVVIVWDEALQRWVTKRDATLAKHERRLEAFGLEPGNATGWPAPHYNVGPRWPVKVVAAPGATSVRPDGGFATARWGFPLPGHRKDVFNTQVERAYASPMWRGTIGRRHAVMPVSGFYEWDHVGGKQPYFVTRADGEAMALACVVGERHVKDPQHDEVMLCASVVTVPPSATIARLHDRMPLILEEGEVDLWLRPGGVERETLLDLAGRREDVVRLAAVGKAVNRTDIDVPELILPDRSPRQDKLM